MKKKEEPSYEEAEAALKAIVERLEKEEPTLEESLRLSEEGIRLLRLCYGKLEEAKGKYETLFKNDRGEAVLDAQGRPKTAPLAPPDDDGD